MEIKKIDVMSVGKLSGFIYAVVGLLSGLLISLFSFSLGSMLSQSSSNNFLSSFGIASIVVFPILYGLMGFVGGVIGAVIYNLAARFVGGIKIITHWIYTLCLLSKSNYFSRIWVWIIDCYTCIFNDSAVCSKISWSRIKNEDIIDKYIFYYMGMPSKNRVIDFRFY